MYNYYPFCFWNISPYDASDLPQFQPLDLNKRFDSSVGYLLQIWHPPYCNLNNKKNLVIDLHLYQSSIFPRDSII